MKRLLLMVLALLLASPCFASWTENASCIGGATAGATSLACSAGMSVTLNDIIICITSTSLNADLSSFSGTGATWTVVASMHVYDASNTQGISGGYGLVTATGTVTPTANWGSSATFRGMACADFTGNATSTPTDGSTATLTSTGTTGSNGHTSGPITTATNGDLLFGGTVDTVGSGATATAGTLSVAFTRITSTTGGGNYVAIEWGTQTTAAASTVADWTFTNADQSTNNILAIKPSGAAAAVCQSRALMGVGC